VTVSRKPAKSRTRGRKVRSTEAKARAGRARKTRADLERRLKAYRQEIARARERLAEATLQQTATSRMLRLLSNSPIQSMLDAVAENAARLCEASNARIWRLEDSFLRLVASYGESSATMDGREGLPANRDTVTGRAACDRRTIHVHDIAAEDREYPMGSSLVKDLGWHTTLATPLLRDGTPIGTILVRRTEVRPFSNKQIALLETFADEAAIAIENVRLFEAEKQHTLALAHANRDLAEREAKIRRLVDSNIIGIFIWDFDGRILEANEAFLYIVGYDHEDLVAGRIRWTDLTPLEWRDRDTRLIQERKTTGTLQPFEKEFFRKNGSRVPVLIGVATFEAGGDQGAAFVLDLTERKRAEERLRVQHVVAQILAEAVTIEESTLRILRAMCECLGWDVGALWLVDRKTETLRCVELWHKASIEVPEFERISRTSSFVSGSGLPGRVWSSLEPVYIADVVPDENFPRAPIAEREGLHAALALPILLGGEALGVIEFFSREIRKPDQELLNVLATIGSQIGQFIERKRGEEALRESEAKLRDYAETASDWFWETGPDYKFTLLTENAFGPHSVDRVGTACWDSALDLETESEKWRLVRETLDARKPFRDFVYRELSGNGSPMYVRASGKPVFEANGEFRGYRGTGTDVTPLMRAQEEHERLRQLESDLVHMNRLSMMGELAASLAHEIAQPIATARNNARAATHFLDRSSPDFGQVREALTAVVNDADRAADILDRIRDQIKKAPPRKERVDLNHAITDVIALAQGAIVKSRVSVQTRFAEQLPYVQVDRVQVQQVILNLILNAVEAMSLFKKDMRDLVISTEQREAGGVLVAVHDSGPGIDPKHLDRVFDAFYTTKSSGVGMGLSICRSIIHAHGGRLWASANMPKGAIFQFTLPNAGENS